MNQSHLLYGDMTWKEIESSVKEMGGRAAIIIPIGCLEEHGPHLPVATDSYLAESFTKALSNKHTIPIVSGPCIDFGVSVLTQGFPGTIRVRFDTLRALMVDVISSCIRWGFRHVFLWTWHGGSSHEIALREAALDVMRSGGDAANIHILRGVKLFDDPAFKARINEVMESNGDHADELETSLMMYTNPDLVRADLLVKEYPCLPGKVITGGRPYMTHGVIGDATLATKEKGEQVFTLILEELERVVRERLNE